MWKATEEKFLDEIAVDPTDDARTVYADWLLERGDPRAEYVILEQRLRNLPEEERDDPFHTSARERLAQLERTLDRGWIGRVKRAPLGPPEPERATISLPPPPPRAVPPLSLEAPPSLVPRVSPEQLDARVVCAGCSNVMNAAVRICPRCGRDRTATLRLAVASVAVATLVLVVGESIRACT